MSLTPRQLKSLRAAPIGSSGNRLAGAIALADVTQADLARTVGMTQQYVNDVTRGRWQTITVENARRLANYFGCAIEDLFPSRHEQQAAAS